jgi:hypothetical protein
VGETPSGRGGEGDTHHARLVPAAPPQLVDVRLRPLGVHHGGLLAHPPDSGSLVQAL